MMWEARVRRWRKTNNRGVSPIIATILLVAITVVLAAVLYVLISGLVHGPGNTPLGSAMSFGSPTLNSGTNGVATALGATTPCTIAAASPALTHYCYTIAIASASTGVTLGSLNYQIVTPSGVLVTLTAGGGVAITNIAGVVYAFTGAASSTGFTYTGTPGTASTQVVSSMTIWVDMGTTSPANAGDILTLYGIGSYSGSVSVDLP